MKKTTRKLSLNTETIRRLTNHDLELVVGGVCKHATTITNKGPLQLEGLVTAPLNGGNPPPLHDIPTC